MKTDINAGDVFIVQPYPFVRTTFMQWEPDGAYERITWKPGHEYIETGPEGEADAVYDGVGKQILTVVSTHKPGRFPERIFFTREWEDPDGKRFTGGGCKIAVRSKFVRLTKGYGFGIDELRELKPRPTPKD